jgi:predicted metal-binding membrane protein
MTEAIGQHLPHQGLPHLSPAASRLGGIFARPRVVAIVCIVALTGLGWFALALMAADQGLFATLCRPSPGGAPSAIGVVTVASMWAAMTLAMMLPSAAPMILTYAEIADTAARKSEPVVSPFALAAGYCAVWLGFAALATLAQLGLTRVSLLDAGLTSASGLLSGAILIGAGFYQFSGLKHACLRQCRSPFPFFFTNWATTPRGVFRLGLKQGLFCVGCCWAMMLVMFTVGIMNVVWMAALGIVMTIEKIGSGKRFSHAIGVVSIAAGMAFVVAAAAAHWPGQAI